MTLPGFGLKTANVVLGNAFGVPGITVDTHFGRLVRRWEWTEETDPVKVEHVVGALFPRREWTDLSHRIIFHGRRVCHARKPACGVCLLAHDCPSYGEGPSTRSDRGSGEGPGDAAPAGPGRDGLVSGLRSALKSSSVRAMIAFVIVIVALVFAMWPRSSPARSGWGYISRGGGREGIARDDGAGARGCRPGTLPDE